jgi:transcriptional regulator with XRE-family HTH domain
VVRPTQRAFARKFGISVGLVVRLTTAPENMTLSTLAKISRALQVTPSQLLDEADAKAAKTFLRLLRLSRQKIEPHCQQRGERG